MNSCGTSPALKCFGFHHPVSDKGEAVAAASTDPLKRARFLYYCSPFDPSCPHWFVLSVRANQEKKTAQRLADHAIEHFLPCYRSVRQWKDRRVILETPLFKGYVFVHLPFAERVKVLSMPSVVGLIGSRNSPSIVSAEEIDCIRRGVEFGHAAPHPAFVEGQQIMITDGVLRGMQGTLLRSQNKTRVVVAIDSIARSFAVEVDISCLSTTMGVPTQERKAV